MISVGLSTLPSSEFLNDNSLELENSSNLKQLKLDVETGTYFKQSLETARTSSAMKIGT